MDVVLPVLLLCVCAACVYLFMRSGVLPGPRALGYALRTRTPLARWLHDVALARAAQGPPHSLSASFDAGGFLVRIVPFLEDNFAYIIVDKETGRCAVVDPGDAAAVRGALAALCAQWDAAHGGGAGGASAGRGDAGAGGLLSLVRARPELTTALITHFHADHCGGAGALAAALPELRIVGSAREAVPHATAVAAHGARFFLGRTEVDVLSVPCHTAGSIAFYAHGPLPGRGGGGGGGGDAGRGGGGDAGGAAAGGAGAPSGALFSGDTLFLGGVGKFFEGGAEDMHNALYGVLRALPGDTALFPGHEYAVANLRFALWLDRGNAALQEKLAWALGRRADKHATVPSLLAEERAYNPFLRAHVPALKVRVAEEVRDARGKDMPEVPVIGAMRRLKDDAAHLRADAAQAQAHAQAQAQGVVAAGGRPAARADEEAAETEPHADASRSSPFATSALDDHAGAAARANASAGGAGDGGGVL
jgi:hydroxyacylglutathione hydrolase